MNDQFSLNPQQPVPYLQLGGSSPPPSEPVAASRAAKATMGLGQTTGMQYDDIYKQIMDGGENDFRDLASGAVSQQAMHQKMQQIGQLPPDAHSVIPLDTIRNYLTKSESNPDSVIEKAYGPSFINTIKDWAKLNPDSEVSQGIQSNPDIDRHIENAGDTLARREYMLKRAQDIQSEVDKDTWLHIPFIKTALTPNGEIEAGSRTAPWSSALNWATLGIYGGLREEYLMRGNTPDTSRLSGVFEGSNIRDQGNELLTQPDFDSFKLKFDAGFDRLRAQDPNLAQQWAASMVGMSADDLVARNAMSAMNIAGGIGVGKTIGTGLKAIGKASLQGVGRAAGTAVEHELTGLETPELWAIRDALRDAPVTPTKTATAEAIGDSPTAAIQKTVQSFAHPNPTKDAVDTMFDAHRVNQDAIRENPGNLSREEHTRLLNAGEGYEQKAVKALIETTKVIRLPELAENGFRDIADSAKDYFRGRENTIVNYDIKHDELTNTEHHIVTIADYDGRPFPSKRYAEIHAENNGYGNPVFVGQDPDVVYLPQTTVMREKLGKETFRDAGGKFTGEPPISEGKTRFYHGYYKGGEPETGGARHVTSSKTYAKNYGEGKRKLAYIDLTKEEAIQAGLYDEINDRPQSLGQLSEDMSKRLKPLSGIREPSETNKKFEPNPNFSYTKNDKGEWRFTLVNPADKEHIEQEITPSFHPEPTHIPFNLKEGKFGQPLAYGPHIVQKGVGYHIKWTIPLDETQDFIRDAMIGPRTESVSTKAVNSRYARMTNGLLGYLRLPADTLSAAEDENRAKVVYTQNNYIKLAQGEMKAIEDLYHGMIDKGNYVKRKSLSYLGNLTQRNKTVWNDFVRALTISQTAEDPVTKLPGYYMKSPSEIQMFWQSNFGRPASAPEVAAYLAASRFDHLDWIHRNISVLKNKFRLGIMEHTINDVVEGGTKPRATFEGRLIKRIPEGVDRNVIIHEGDGNIRFYSALNPDAKSLIREDFKKGEYTAVQLHDPDAYPIKVFDKEGNHVRVGYVVSRRMSSQNIKYQQVGIRGGGHWDYNYNHYVKQPIIRRQIINGRVQWNYSGDATFSPIGNNLDGATIASKLSEIRRLLRDKKIAEAKALHQATFDQKWNDFVKNFYPRKNRATGELEPSRFNLHEDFRVVPKGFTIAEHDKKLISKYERLPGKFVNATKEQSLARNFQVEYTGARDSHDLFEPYNTGTIQNPMYKFKPAELTDPITTMSRSMNRIVNSTYMDDYKHMAVLHWLEENMDLLEGNPKEIRSSPFWYFQKGDLKRGSGLRGQIANSNRYKIRKLIGMPTYMDSIIHEYKQELADQIFENRAKGGVARAGNSVLVPASWMLHKINSPTNLVRGLAFHENLGFFNWAQMAAQNMGWINVFSLAPTHAPSAMFASWMHIWSRINMSDNFLNHLDKMAGVFGWKPGEWREAMAAYEKSGFHQLGNSLVVDNPNKQNFMIGEGKRLMRNGTVFFDLAEQNVRHGSWYAAYHEFKRAFPDAKMDDVAIGKILRRANNIYMNMGRDSKTLLNTGITSVTLQFYKYIENVGQQFFSKRIGEVFGKENTWQTRLQQRAQMILMYSLAFGPAGATGLSLLPINDWIRQHEIKQGYVPGADPVSTLLMEGPLSMAGAYASGWARTGSWDMSKGTFYNYNNRYGVNGYQLLRDLLEPSPILWKIILGASGSTIANTMQSLSPFVYAMSSSYNDEQNAPFAVTMQDWKELAENFNSVRYADRLWHALQFGKWVDRHGRNIQDIGQVDAVLRTLLGTNDQKVDDAYLKTLIKEHERQDYSQAEKEYQHYRRLAEQAAMNNDPDQAKIFNRNAVSILHWYGVPPEQASKIFAQDANLNKNTLDQTNWSFYKKLVPVDRIGAAQKGWEATNKGQ